MADVSNCSLPAYREILRFDRFLDVHHTRLTVAVDCQPLLPQTSHTNMFSVYVGGSSRLVPVCTSNAGGQGQQVQQGQGKSQVILHILDNSRYKMVKYD